MTNAIAHHGRGDLDGRDVRSEALSLDRHEERRRGAIVLVTASAGIWAGIAIAAWGALQTLI